MGAGEAAVAEIQRAIEEVRVARAEVIEFENENADVIREYHRLYSEMRKAEETLTTRMAALPVAKGERVDFDEGWYVQCRVDRKIDPKVVMALAPTYIKQHPETVKITLKSWDTALRAGHITAEVYNKAIYEEAGSVIPKIPPFKKEESDGQ
jgi:hypothetical protein